MNLNGKEKSAVFLVLVGIDKATEILKELSMKEIEDIIKYISNINFISNEVAIQVLSEFNISFNKCMYDRVNFISKKFIISLLEKVLGENDATLLLKKIQYKKNISDSLKKLNMIPLKNIVDILKNEHPQIITTILFYLDRTLAANILSCFEEKLCIDIITRITKFSGVHKCGESELVGIINNLLQKCEFSFLKKKGISVVIELLKLINKSREKNILDKMLVVNETLAKTIQIEMLEFSDILYLDDIYIRCILNEFSLEKLSIVFRASAQQLKEKFYKNMPQENIDFINNLCCEDLSMSDEVILEHKNKLLDVVKNILRKNSSCFSE
ncbi:MAG: FliG C-terminal domain-containing protein [Buchnera aphidicola (Chaetogeoica yunlongensis)]